MTTTTVASGSLQSLQSLQSSQSATRRSRSALPITETELNVIAAAASIGLSRTPTKG